MTRDISFGIGEFAVNTVMDSAYGGDYTHTLTSRDEVRSKKLLGVRRAVQQETTESHRDTDELKQRGLQTVGKQKNAK